MVAVIVIWVISPPAGCGPGQTPWVYYDISVVVGIWCWGVWGHFVTPLIVFFGGA